MAHKALTSLHTLHLASNDGQPLAKTTLIPFRPSLHTAKRRKVVQNTVVEKSRYIAAASVPQSVVNAEHGNAAKLAVFVSGGGSNFRAIHSQILDGRIHAQVAVVVSNNPTCGGCTYAEQHGIPVLVYPASKKYPQGLDPQHLVEALQGHGVDFVILAGYLKLIPPELVRAFPKKMLNIHPGLLPSFGGPGMYGQRVHQAVISSGVRFSGPTVHFVDEEYDSGAILAQRVVPVLPDDTPQVLAARVLQQEHQVYPEAVAALCEGRIGWREDGIPYMWTKK